MPERNPHEMLLSAVIPVTSVNSRWAQIASWLERTPQNVKVIFIHDTAIEQEKTYFRENLQKIDFDNFEVHEVDFKSPGMSRNYGLSQVRSELVCFWDSDDVPLISNIANCIHHFSSEVEVVVGQYETLYSDGSKKVTISKDFKVEDIFLRSPGLWRMIFRSNILKNCQFSNLRMAEDQIFLLDLELNSRSILFTQNIVYSYIKGDANQLTNNIDALLSLPAAIKEILKKARGKTGKQVDLCNIVLFRLMLTSLKRFRLIGIHELMRIIYLYISSDLYIISKFKALGLLIRERFLR